MKDKPIPPKVKPKPKLNIPQTLLEHINEENGSDQNNNTSLQQERETLLNDIYSTINEALEEFEQIYKELMNGPPKINIKLPNGNAN